MKIAEMVYELIKCRDDVTYADLEDIFDWVKLNYDTLYQIYKMYETGIGHPQTLIDKLRKI